MTKTNTPSNSAAQTKENKTETPAEISYNKPPTIPRDAFDKCILDGGKVTVSYDGSTPKERVCGNNKIPYIEYSTAGLAREKAVYNVSAIKLTELGSEKIGGLWC